MEPLLIDMVHHNPGEPPFTTRFSDPGHLRSYGFTGQAFKHINAAATLDAVAPGVFPADEEQAQWLKKFTAERAEEVRRAASAGLDPFYHIDLFVLPKPILDHFGEELLDPETGRISVRREKTREVHRALFDEIFAGFPEIRGLIIRVGETYLYDTPHHAGNGAVSYAEGISPAAQIEEFVELIGFLREEICERHGRTLIHRTWDTKPDRFHSNRDFYLAVTDRVAPHPNLLFSIKHTSVDFHRWTRFNPCLGQGRHPQIVEIQCQREYEGKGAFPNYIASGVIEGFPEQAEPRGIGSLLDDPRFAGIYTWSRGGGWYGPYIQNELWCDLNAWVLAQFVRQRGTAREPDLFARYCKEVLRLGDGDASALRQICLLSEQAVVKGRNCRPYDGREKPRDENPTCTWMRDDCLGGMEQLGAVFRHLEEHSLQKDAVEEKQECVRLWREMLRLAESLSGSCPAETKKFVVESCRYGLMLFEAVAAAWEALLVAKTPSAAARALEKLDAYRSYAAGPESPATPYKDRYWAWPGKPPPPGLRASLEALLGR